jgi:hypothetical protein
VNRAAGDEIGRQGNQWEEKKKAQQKDLANGHLFGE